MTKYVVMVRHCEFGDWQDLCVCLEPEQAAFVVRYLLSQSGYATNELRIQKRVEVEEAR